MSDELNKVVEALKSETVSLKEVIERLNAEKSSLKDTVNEIIQVNINYRSAAYLMDKQAHKMAAEIHELKQKLEQHKNEVANQELAAEVS